MHALNAPQPGKRGLHVHAYDAASKAGRSMGRIHKISGECIGLS